MAALGRASPVLSLCLLLLPAVIGTQSGELECAFSDHVQSQGVESDRGSANELRGVVRENGTIHCSHGFRCFGLWEKKSGGEIHLVKQGCWTSQPECLSDRCTVTALPAQIQNGSYRFCCCSHDLCNANFTEAPPTATAPVLRHADPPLHREETAVIALVTVGAAAIVILALLCGYWIIRGKQKLSLSTLNEMETANISSVDLESLKLLELIGRGQYGSVFRGSMNERYVAVKVFSSAKRQNYSNECSIYSLPLLRQQDNIAHFLFASEWNNSDGCTEFFIVMEYYPHGCLSRFLSLNSVDWTTCCRMMHGVTRGLAFLHSEIYAGDEYKEAVAHRDVSSKNVLVRSDLSCVLADFGLSMKLKGERSCRNRDDDNLAISEVGTLRYMAPEVLGGALNLREYETALKQVDVYALGLLYWESFRRCSNLFPGEAVPDYQLAFQMELGNKPSLEDMQVLVVREKYRPLFPETWRDNSLMLRLLKETIEDCWDQDAEARLTAQCAEERLAQLALLNTHNKHRNTSNGYPPPVGSSPLENFTQTAPGSVLSSDSELTGVAVCLPQTKQDLKDNRVDPKEVSIVQPSPDGAAGRVLPLPKHQRPSSLQLLSRASETSPPSSRLRLGRPQASARQVETGVAKMNSVAVLAAPEPRMVTTVTNRTAVVMIANGYSAGIPTLVTNSLIVRGRTNPAGPLMDEDLPSSNIDKMASAEQEVGQNLNFSPDEHQPLLRNEQPPAGTHFLTGQRSNSNNNNNRNSTYHKMKSSDTSHRPALNQVSVPKQPTKTSFISHPLYPSDEISDRDAEIKPTNAGEFTESWNAPCVQPNSIQDKSQESIVALHQVSHPKWKPLKTCYISQAVVGTNDSLEEVYSVNQTNSLSLDIKSINPAPIQVVSLVLSLDQESATKVPESTKMSAELSQSQETAVETQPALLTDAAPSAPDIVLRNQDVFTDLPKTTTGQDKPRKPERPCSLDLSSPSAFPDGAPLTDTGLSASGEKIKRRVKTPYTVKKWRPASWVVPAESAFDFHIAPDQPLFRSGHQKTLNTSKINQSKSSMAVFLVGGGTTTATAASNPDRMTSF